MARLPLEIREEIYEHSLLDAGDKDEEVDLLAPCIPLLFVSNEMNAEVLAVMTRLKVPSCEHKHFSCEVTDHYHGTQLTLPGEHALNNNIQWLRLHEPAQGETDKRLLKACYKFLRRSRSWNFSKHVQRTVNRVTGRWSIWMYTNTLPYAPNVSHFTMLLRVVEEFSLFQSEKAACRSSIGATPKAGEDAGSSQGRDCTVRE
ncbi:hypothetical protein LTS10_000011 [Elasticomyces elasticus]|nr:hypothetical protein LTS10_000011 [Elasticomyces elasticus]